MLVLLSFPGPVTSNPSPDFWRYSSLYNMKGRYVTFNELEVVKALRRLKEEDADVVPLEGYIVDMDTGIKEKITFFVNEDLIEWMPSKSSH